MLTMMIIIVLNDLLYGCYMRFKNVLFLGMMFYQNMVAYPSLWFRFPLLWLCATQEQNILQVEVLNN